MPPTKDEIKIVAQEVAEHYFGMMKEYIEKEIVLHKAQCSAGKFTRFLGIIYAAIGGILVAIANWFIPPKGGTP